MRLVERYLGSVLGHGFLRW